jgi:hypothetical protein
MPSKTETKAPTPCDPGIIEISLMLTRGQFDALEERAGGAGMSVAQFLRELVCDSIAPDSALA